MEPTPNGNNASDAGAVGHRTGAIRFRWFGLKGRCTETGGANSYSSLPCKQTRNNEAKCRRCGKEFDFPYEVARRNLHGHQIIYPKHCKPCLSELNSGEQVGRFTYPGRDGERILQEYDPKWPKTIYGISQYFVYILSMTGTRGVEFYVGHTEDIRGRVRTHVSNQDPRTRGKNPKLVWFCEVATREKATRLEAELKGVNEQNSELIEEMALSFKNVARQLDYTTLKANG